MTLVVIKSSSKTFTIEDTKVNIIRKYYPLTGDEQNIITLSSQVNENFPHFSPSQQKTTKFTGTKEQNLELYSIDPRNER